jgi:2-polyprenyl-3-methyl-5-hydroxy-6-metoxy-1,4-benzoquinol methylase
MAGDLLYHSRVRRDMFPLIPPGRRALDVGGGYGATVAALRDEGFFDYTGVIDKVPAATPLAYDFHYSGDVEDPDLLRLVGDKEGPFDTILCLDTLEHLVDPWSLICRLTTLLAPGGAIVASIPNVRHYSVSVPLLFLGRWHYQDTEILDRTHLRFFVRSTAIELMESSGLIVDAVAAIPRQRIRDKLARVASFGLADSILALQYGIRARKP